MQALELKTGSYDHGTRARYVSGCHCADCKASNTRYYHERRARELEALAELEPGPPARERPIAHLKLDRRTGRRVLHRFKNPCPGLGRTEAEQEAGCPWASFLRKDSQAVCMRCRAESVADHLVDTARARRRIRALSKKGIGYKAVADAAGISHTIVMRIRAGTKKQIRLSTERRILALDEGARADASLVDAGPTWKILDELLAEEGFTKTELARRLGYKRQAPSLQIKRGGKILARTAHKIERFYRMLNAEA
jgi:DNA-binding Xre family transcriptional regulator